MPIFKTKTPLTSTILVTPSTNEEEEKKAEEGERGNSTVEEGEGELELINDCNSIMYV